MEGTAEHAVDPSVGFSKVKRPVAGSFREMAGRI
jgi:hypothetical protein